jgi:hypothetical protein
MLQQLEARILYDAAIGAEVASVITSATATHTADVDVVAVHEYSSAAVNHLVTEQAVADTHPLNSQIVDHATEANAAVAANHPVDKVTDYINALSSNNSSIQNSYYSFDKAQVKEVIFVDQNVHNYVDLLKGVDLNKLISGQLEIVMLQDNTSGVNQIANYLDQFDHQIDTVHVVSHGTAGKIYLGNDIVTDANLGNYKADFANWSQGLANQADVLFYGCSIAANGVAGQKFVDDLHNIIHADIAASSDITSSTALGGNWVLEVTNGAITAKSAFSTSVQQNYHDLLAPITVSNFTDIVNGNTSSITNLINSDGGDGISLREAIMAANNTPGADIINFSAAGQVTLTSQLSITDDLTIDGTTAPGYTTTPGPNNSSGHYVLPNPAFTILTLGNFIGPDISISNTAVVHISGLGLSGHGNDGGISGGGPGSTFQYNNLSAPVNTLIVSSDNIDISNNSIGGSFNSGNGILVTGGQQINIHENFFYSLGHGVAVTGSASQVNITNNTFFTFDIPIDLGNNGVTVNDNLDSDTGPNNLQNYPVLTSATEQTISGINRYVIGGTLNSEANTSYRIDYYSSSEDPSGGVYFPKFLGSETVTTDGSGNVNLNFVYTGTAANLAGPFITATASKVISANVFETSEFSSSVTLTDTIYGDFNLSSVSNPIGATNKITSTPAGLVLSGTITEPTAQFTTFNIRNILYATSNINSIVATGTPVIDSINGTWTFTLNVTLPVGAYRVEAVGTDFNSSQQFTANVGSNTFLIIPAVDNSASNELGVVTVDPSLSNGLGDISLSGTSSLSTTSRVVVAVPNLPGAQYLELTTTGYLASSPSNTWSDYGSHFPTPTVPYPAGIYDTQLYVFGAGGTYDSTVTTGNIILDPLNPTAATFNTIATPIAQSNVAITQFSGTFTENMGVREITLLIADHIDTSNLLAHFNHGDFYRIELPGNTNFVIPGTTQLTGSININPVSGYTSYVNGTYTIDLGQLNNVLTAPLGGSTTYDVAVIASDLVGHTNVDLFSLTDGVNIFRDAITISNQVVDSSGSTTSSSLTNALDTTIDSNTVVDSTNSVTVTDSNTDNGTIISSDALNNDSADNSTDDGGDLIGSSGDEGIYGNSGEDNAPAADNSNTTDASTSANAVDASTTQPNADAAAAATLDSGSSTDSSTDSNSSSTSDTSGSTATTSHDDSSSSGATQSISDFVNNAVDAVGVTISNSVDYATKNQNVAAATVAVGAAPALASGISAASTTATISSATSSVQAASMASNMTSQAANVSQIATRPTAHMAPKLGGRAFSNSTGKSSRSASPNSADDGGPAEKCKCAVCLALKTTGVNIV